MGSNSLKPLIFALTGLILGGCGMDQSFRVDILPPIQPPVQRVQNPPGSQTPFEENGNPWTFFGACSNRYINQQLAAQVTDSTGIRAGLDGSSTLDRAGQWSVFGPGQGNSAGPVDFRFIVEFTTSQARRLAAVVIIHGVYNEGWSTISEQVFQKGLYPAVVFRDGVQLNTSYDQPLGDYAAGTHRLEIFAQPEQSYCDAQIFLRFTDGTILMATAKRLSAPI